MYLRRLLGATALCAMLVLTGCCAPTIPQTVGSEFQGGSSTVQAAGKVLNDRWDTMNADDIQLLPQLATQFGLVDEELPEITDDQAQAVVDFIAANDIVSLEDLETLFEEAEADPSSVVIPDSVRDVLEDFAASGELSDEDTQNLEDFLNN